MPKIRYLKEGTFVGRIEIIWPAWYVVYNHYPVGPYASRDMARRAIDDGRHLDNHFSEMAGEPESDPRPSVCASGA